MKKLDDIEHTINSKYDNWLLFLLDYITNAEVFYFFTGTVTAEVFHFCIDLVYNDKEILYLKNTSKLKMVSAGEAKH